jgi:hypothetical protein
MTEESKKEHERQVKNKNIGEAREYLRAKRIRNRWVEEKPKDIIVEVPERINLVIDRSNMVTASYWG